MVKGILKKRAAKPRKRVSFAITEKSIAQVAKKAVMKVAETKSAINKGFLAPLDELVACQNLNHFQVQGDTSEAHTGQEIYIKNIRLRGHILKANAATNDDDTIVRVMVIRTISALANTTNNNISAANIFRTGGTTDYHASSAHVDFNKVSLLYDKQFVLSPKFTGARPMIPLNLNIMLDKNHKFNQDNSGYFKDGNYYLIVSSYDGNSVSAPALVEYDWTVNYKDV